MVVVVVSGESKQGMRVRLISMALTGRGEGQHAGDQGDWNNHCAGHQPNREHQHRKVLNAHRNAWRPIVHGQAVY
ncbi:MAG: hypothetical protein M3439_10440, partial [Chloroflexota bacterium]|nr:hypothetical protein [Chloroflexota bacterium]